MPEPEETSPVRQRNTTGYAYTFAGEPPVRVEVGEVHEHPVLLNGWTVVDGEPAPVVDEAAPKTPRKRAAVADIDKEGGESR